MFRIPRGETYRTSLRQASMEDLPVRIRGETACTIAARASLV